MRLLRTIADLDQHLAASGGLVAPTNVLVPTMGALHAGHVELVRRAAAEAQSRGLAGGALVWIFVNPTQFNQPADLARYPRTLDADCRECEIAGARAVFAPDVETVYPSGAAVAVPPLPAVATQPGLEDAHRPGHFAGVCQVVKRMFELCRPAAAIFGEKDWQQLAVIRAMVRQERLGIEIIPARTVREHDGLAMSSRNVFLTPRDRLRAVGISRALFEAKREPTPERAEARMREVLASEQIRTQYAVVRDADTLGPPRQGQPCRGLIAAEIGSVRLIDNEPMEFADSGQVRL